MHVHCPHCGTRVEADDLNIERAIARCRQCDAVFSFDDALQQDSPAVRRYLGARTIPTPTGMTVEELGGTLRFTQRWWRPSYLFLLFFCIAWDGFLVAWYTMALVGPFGDAPGPVRWLPIIFPIAHVAVGAALTYFVLCGFINRTVVEVGQGILSIRHGPLPWLGNHTLRTVDIDQLYCRERTRSTDNGLHYSYELHALDRGGKKHTLLRGLSDPEDALYLEQQIESQLGIADRRVAGEYEK